MSQRRPMVILTGAAVLAGALVFFFFDPAQGGWFPRCQFHKLTGLNCAGCGSLRALHHLTHGEFGAAFRSNPLLLLLLPCVTFVAGRWCWYGNRAFDSVFFRPVAIWTLLGLTIAFAILRNLPWPAFAWMSP